MKANTHSKFKDTDYLIPKRWQKISLGELITFKRGHDLPIKERINGNYPIVASNGIVGYHDKFKAKGPGVTIGRSGNLGKAFFIEEDYWPLNTTLYSIDFHESDPKFIYYFLKTLPLHEFNSGSAVPSLNRNLIHPIEIIVPQTDEQIEIAKILSSLDEKIELNQKMNQTLEEIGQAIFKHWFVHFEFPNEDGKPYKSSGGEMLDSELGEIPKSWEIGNLSSLISITSGKRPNEKFEEKKGDFKIPLIGASSLMGFVKETLYNEPILVIGRVGTHGIVQKVLPPSYPSDNTLVIKSKYYEFVYQILTGIDYDSLNVGTTQPLITQKSIKNHEIIIPSSDILLKFEKIASTLFLKLNQNNLEIEKLSQIRDSILPKLMSGKIRVNS